MQMFKFILQLPLILFFSIVFSSCSENTVVENDQVFSESKTTLIENHCIECHGLEKQKGKVRLDNLYDGQMTEEKMELIKTAIEVVSEGDMPPEKKAVLSESDKDSLIRSLRDLVNVNAESLRKDNQTHYRRLNNLEYLNSVAELFGFDPSYYNPTKLFPADQRYEGVAKIGSESLSSKFLLNEYISASHDIVDKMVRYEKKPVISKIYSFKKEKLNTQYFGDNYVVLVRSIYAKRGGSGQIILRDFAAPEDGYYQMRVHANALNQKHNLPTSLFRSDQEEPLRMVVKTGEFTQEMDYRATFDLDETKKWYTAKIWLDKGQSAEIIAPDLTVKDFRARSKSFYTNKKILKTLNVSPKKAETYIKANYNKVIELVGFPQLRVYEVQMEGPFYEEWSPTKNIRVFPNSTLSKDNWESTLIAFASKAFRQPQTKLTILPLIERVEDQIAQGLSLESAFNSGLKAILLSPRFLFIQENNEKLDSYEIASRLSYFLWSSTPDKELLNAAKQGRLKSEDEILRQVDRMLADDRSQNFVEDFSSSWLQLYDLGTRTISGKAFPQYRDLNVKRSVKRETLLYFKHILTNNLNIREFIDSDYSFLNRRLSKFYGLPPLNDFSSPVAFDQYGGLAPSTAFVKYKFTDKKRGGLLGHSSILTVSANGVDTSPIVRGAWVLEKLMNNPPPAPPADVASIEPDTRNAKSLKDRLRKHQADESCASCHKKMDPIGFALENYDAVGQWREKYKFEKTVDSSGVYEGVEFKDITDFKEVLLKDADRFSEAFAEKLLIYAIGRKVTFLDEEEIHKINSLFKEKNYQLKDLVKIICTSPLFHMK